MTRAAAASRDLLEERLSRGLRVEPVSGDRIEDLALFLKQAHADQPLAHRFQELEQIVRYWRWLHQECPRPVPEEQPRAWICLREGRIVGHFAVLPALAAQSGQPLPIWWGSHLIVAPEARRGNVGPLLILSALRATGKKPFLTLGLNERSHTLFHRLGFLDLGRIPLYLKVYDPSRLLETIPWSRFPRRMAAGLMKVVLSALPRKRRRDPGWKVSPVDRFDERFDRWWESVEKAFPHVVRRTAATLRWRYQDHPLYRYWALAVTRGQTFRGLAIVRHGHSRGMPAGFITELLADPRDREAMDTLLEEAEALLLNAAAEKPAFLRCAVLHRPFEQALRRAGFLPAPSPIRWMMAHREGIPALGPLARREGWFLNGGDSDLDAT